MPSNAPFANRWGIWISFSDLGAFPDDYGLHTDYRTSWSTWLATLNGTAIPFDTIMGLVDEAIIAWPFGATPDPYDIGTSSGGSVYGCNPFGANARGVVPSHIYSQFAQYMGPYVQEAAGRPYRGYVDGYIGSVALDFVRDPGDPLDWCRELIDAGMGVILDASADIDYRTAPKLVSLAEALRDNNTRFITESMGLKANEGLIYKWNQLGAVAQLADPSQVTAILANRTSWPLFPEPGKTIALTFGNTREELIANCLTNLRAGLHVRAVSPHTLLTIEDVEFLNEIGRREAFVYNRSRLSPTYSSSVPITIQVKEKPYPTHAAMTAGSTGITNITWFSKQSSTGDSTQPILKITITPQLSANGTNTYTVLITAILGNGDEEILQSITFEHPESMHEWQLAANQPQKS